MKYDFHRIVASSWPYHIRIAARRLRKSLDDTSYRSYRRLYIIAFDDLHFYKAGYRFILRQYNHTCYVATRAESRVKCGRGYIIVGFVELFLHGMMPLHFRVMEYTDWLGSVYFVIAQLEMLLTHDYYH